MFQHVLEFLNFLHFCFFYCFISCFVFLFLFFSVSLFYFLTFLLSYLFVLVLLVLFFSVLVTFKTNQRFTNSGTNIAKYHEAVNMALEATFTLSFG